jgi:hypothetical protein
MATGIELIAQERQRQIEKEGWTPEHDDEHDYGELAIAAACYAVEDTDAWVTHPEADEDGVRYWPWASEEWKPKDTISNLVRAGALIAAEIDRINREAQKVRIPGAVIKLGRNNEVPLPTPEEAEQIIEQRRRALAEQHSITSVAESAHLSAD